MAEKKQRLGQWLPGAAGGGKALGQIPDGAVQLGGIHRRKPQSLNGAELPDFGRPGGGGGVLEEQGGLWHENNS